jgi:POT family proton-dependent oligopeptide transporter
MNDIQTPTLKQPQVFPLTIATSMLERFGFYIISFILVLYVEQRFNFTDYQSYTLFSLFTALVALTPAIGGYLADNILGIRRSIIIGLILETLGMTLFLVPTKLFLYFALAFIIVGVGLFKTGPLNLLARGYVEDDPRIDGGFTLFYMTINIGSMISAVMAGYSQRYFGWHMVFLCSSIGLGLSLLSYFLLRHRAKLFDNKLSKISLPSKTWLKIVMGIIVGFIIFVSLIYRPIIAHIFFYAATACVVLYFGYEIAKSPKNEKFKIIACLSLIVFGMMFFVMYFQLSSSLILFIDRCVVHKVWGFYIPTVTFISLNSFWIVVLSPILFLLYKHLGKAHKDLAITTKFSLGLLISTLAFLILKLSTLFANGNYQISVAWLTFSIALFSLGELLISALGVAMVARIAPRHMYGFMMGSWFLIAQSVGSTLGGKVAILAAIPTTLHDPAIILNTYGNVFLEIGIGGLIITIIAFIVSPSIKRFANIT